MTQPAPPEYYDPTFEYLKKCGNLELLDAILASA